MTIKLSEVIGAVTTTPDQMVLLDSIASSFNGATTQFTLKTSNVNFINTEIDSVARLIISVGGTIQAPDPTQGAGFYLSGGTDRTTDPIKINFVEPPRAGQTFFGTAVKSTVSAVTPYASPSLSIAYAIALG